jgi:hypothetical protein
LICFWLLSFSELSLPRILHPIFDRRWSAKDIDEHPALCFVGAAGAGKKTAAQWLKQQVDSSSEHLVMVSLPSGQAQVVRSDRCVELHASMFRSVEDTVWFQDQWIHPLTERQILIVHGPNVGTQNVWKWAHSEKVWCWFVCKGLFHPRSFSGHTIRIPHWNPSSRSNQAKSVTIGMLRQRKCDHLSEMFASHGPTVNHMLESWWRQPELCHRVWELELLLASE